MSILNKEYLAPHELQTLQFLCGTHSSMQEVINTVIRQQPGSLALQRLSWSTLSGLPSQMPYEAPVLPLALASAKGAHITDVDHNTYLDCSLGNASMILGHNPDEVVEVVQEKLSQGVGIGQLYAEQLHLAQLIQNTVPDIERVAYLNSSAEAIAAAVRMARVVTRKQKVAKFEGCYHGANAIGLSNPQMILSGQFPTDAIDQISPKVATGGFTASEQSDLLILAFNSETAFALIRQHAADLACIVVDPMPQFMSNWPEVCKSFIQELCSVAKQAEVAVIFDETQCGFRLMLGGAREWANVTPDISCYEASACGLGVPIAILAGSAKYLDTARTSGQFVDYPSAKVWMNSSTTGNYLAVIAAFAQLSYVAQGFFSVGAQLDDSHAYLKQRLAKFAVDTGIPVSIQGHPRLQLQLSLGKQEPKEQSYRGVMQSASMSQFRSLMALSFYLRVQRVYTKLIPTVNLSTAHQLEDLEVLATAIEQSLLQMSQDQMLAF